MNADYHGRGQFDAYEQDYLEELRRHEKNISRAISSPRDDSAHNLARKKICFNFFNLFS
jgi:hypothetical protein